jgi:enterochelin esterase-like enzyme
MKTRWALLLLVMSTVSLAQAPARRPVHGRVVIATVHSAALEGNLLGDPADQKMGIYLPPSYATNKARRYPVLYLLHGFGGSGVGWFKSPEPGSPKSARLLQQLLDDAIASGAIREMIVVTPNGHSKRVGSFYVNSTVDGNWEDFVTRDVVAYVDSLYRTIAAREARGLAGFSMGGFGALVLGARHTDAFGAVYALSPCCTAMLADLSRSNPAWKTLLQAQAEQRAPTEAERKDFYVEALWALASALSPDPRRAGFLADLPYKLESGELVEDPTVHQEWEEKLPLAVLPAHAEQLQRLLALRIDYGMQDDFPHIPAGARAVSEALAAQGVPHDLSTFTGTHMDHMQDRIRNQLLPFMSQALRH